jgi:hypothetical protein
MVKKRDLVSRCRPLHDFSFRVLYWFSATIAGYCLPDHFRLTGPFQCWKKQKCRRIMKISAFCPLAMLKYVYLCPIPLNLRILASFTRIRFNHQQILNPSLKMIEFLFSRAVMCSFLVYLSISFFFSSGKIL